MRVRTPSFLPNISPSAKNYPTLKQLAMAEPRDSKEPPSERYDVPVVFWYYSHWCKQDVSPASVLMLRM